HEWIPLRQAESNGRRLEEFHAHPRFGRGYPLPRIRSTAGSLPCDRRIGHRDGSNHSRIRRLVPCGVSAPRPDRTKRIAYHPERRDWRRTGIANCMTAASGRQTSGKIKEPTCQTTRPEGALRTGSRSMFKKNMKWITGAGNSASPRTNSVML